MPLVATASKHVRNKNFLLVVLCGVFAYLFVVDGFFAYAKSNDALIKAVSSKANEAEKATLDKWPGWSNATEEQQESIYNTIVKKYSNDKWHNPLDMFTQKALALVLAAITAFAIWWLIHCQRRRVTADDSGLVAVAGEKIPWDNITVIDNTRWKKSGIVNLTYTDAEGKTAETRLDEYHLDNLRPILQELERRAAKASFIPPPNAPAPAADEAGSAGGAKSS